MSAPNVRSCPPDVGLEIAFAGRSNAGKSSAINTLTDQTKLARISKTPGRTQLINFFSLGNDKHLVDLPGYGYAKVPPAVQAKWKAMMSNYFEKRQALKGAVIVMDSRHPMKAIDIQMIDWCSHNDLACHLLLTKSDKLSKNQGKKCLFEVEKANKHRQRCTVQLFSSHNKSGLETLQKQLNEWLET